MKRILKPGGVGVIVDSLQEGDVPEFDSVLADFPEKYHEPFYKSYLADPLSKLIESEGFEVLGEEKVFLSKAVTFKKPH